MSVVLKLICILTILAITEFGSVNSAGAPCGNELPDKKAIQLAPCATAARNARMTVPKNCCDRIKTFKPRCLCAVLLSNTAKKAGVNLGIAVTIPKRCNLPRPKGKKCGAYIVP